MQNHVLASLLSDVGLESHTFHLLNVIHRLNLDPDLLALGLLSLALLTRLHISLVLSLAQQRK